MALVLAQPHQGPIPCSHRPGCAERSAAVVVDDGEVRAVAQVEAAYRVGVQEAARRLHQLVVFQVVVQEGEQRSRQLVFSQAAELEEVRAPRCVVVLAEVVYLRDHIEAAVICKRNLEVMEARRYRALVASLVEVLEEERSVHLKSSGVTLAIHHYVQLEGRALRQYETCFVD
jgi:hypothetical protein